MSETNVTSFSNHIDDKGKDINKISKAVNEGMSQQLWNTIEQKISPMEIAILGSLVAHALSVTKGNIDENVSVSTDVKRVLSDKFYVEVRKLFVIHGLVNRSLTTSLTTSPQETTKDVDSKNNHTNKTKKKTQNKNAKKISMTADEIRSSNAVSKIQKDAEQIITTFGETQLTPQIGFRSEFIEFVGMTFIYMARFILRNVERYQKDMYYNQVLSLMVSMQRFIEKCSNYQGIDPVNPSARTTISKIFLDDLQACYDDMDRVFPFDGMIICTKAPELLVSSPFDEYVHETAVSPRQHQRDVVISFYKNFRTGFFTVYNAMINSGKTSTIVSLAEITKYFGKTLLFVCNLDTVRIQAANACYNVGIKFAIGSLRPDGTIKLSYHWSSSAETNYVIICSPDVAFQLLTSKSDPIKGPASERYVLFHDEPTIGADTSNSGPLYDNVKILMNIPKWTFFSSATAPDDLDIVINNAKEKFPNIIVDKVYSPTVQIGCEVRTIDGELVVPYIGCKTRTDLEKVIKKTADVPFIGRMLTPFVALHLYKQLIDFGIVEVPDIPKLFRKVENMRADKIRIIVIDMLNIMTKQQDNIIEQICNSKLLETPDSRENTNVNKKKDEDPNDFTFEFETEEETQQPCVDESQNKLIFSKLGVGEIWKGMTLIASTDPCKFALEYFEPLLVKLYNSETHRVKSADDIICTYKRDIDLWKTRMDKILKNLECNEFDKGRREQDLIDQKPTIKFPGWAQIGTLEYCKHFIEPKNRSKIVDTRSPNVLELIFDQSGKQSNESKKHKHNGAGAKNETSVCDKFLLLLFCGIGIYAPSDRSVDALYTATVLEYASSGRLAYVVANNAISFGTNYPFGRVIITEDFSNEHSICTLFQLMGRAGRVGKLAKAEASVATSAGLKLIDFTIHPEKYNIEGQNIKLMFESIKIDIQTDIEKEIRMMEEELLQLEKNVINTNIIIEEPKFIKTPIPVPIPLRANTVTRELINNNHNNTTIYDSLLFDDDQNKNKANKENIPNPQIIPISQVFNSSYDIKSKSKQLYDVNNTIKTESGFDSGSWRRDVKTTQNVPARIPNNIRLDNESDTKKSGVWRQNANNNNNNNIENETKNSGVWRQNANTNNVGKNGTNTNAKTTWRK